VDARTIVDAREIFLRIAARRERTIKSSSFWFVRVTPMRRKYLGKSRQSESNALAAVGVIASVVIPGMTI
jgi:hypothetical protein